MLGRNQMSANHEGILEVWKKTVEVQQHFNDIAIKIRNLAVTVLAALLSAAALSLKADMATIGPAPGTPLASYLLGAALVAWVGFYMMDRFWYHRLLIGAVRHGEAIEKKWGDAIPGIELACTIRKESAIHLWKWKGKRVEFRSHHRVDLFYGLGATLLIVSIVGVNSFPPSMETGADATSPIKLECHCADDSAPNPGRH